MKYLILVTIIFSNTAFADIWSATKSKSYYAWNSTKYFFSTKEGYKAVENLMVVDDLTQCSSTSTGKILPRNSLFQIPRPDDRYKISATELIIQVTYVGGDSPDLSLRDGLMRLCLGTPAFSNYSNENQEYRYKRIGGMTTGLLVVPYKWRESGDSFSGEATVGPYWGFRNEFFTLALTAGLSQVGITETDSDTIKYETGFSYAAGFIFNINSDFDIALVAGKDHLFGDVGDQYEHQDEAWYSFAIGYKFSK